MEAKGQDQSLLLKMNRYHATSECLSKLVYQWKADNDTVLDAWNKVVNVNGQPLTMGSRHGALRVQKSKSGVQ